MTRGRIQHLLFGAVIVLLAGFAGTKLGGQPRLTDWGQWGFFVVFLYALVWEAATPLLAQKFFPDWDHPYGDFPDWMAYFIGGVIPLFIMDKV